MGSSSHEILEFIADSWWHEKQEKGRDLVPTFKKYLLF